MTEHCYIYTTTEADRDRLAEILVRAGYTVRKTRERKNGGSSGAYNVYIEYWPGPQMKTHKEATRE